MSAFSRLLRPTLTALAVATTVTLAACGNKDDASSSGSGSSTASTPKVQTVRIALDYTANVNYLGIYAAIANGDFKKQGIDPKIIPYAGTPAETLIKAGKTDLGISFPPEIIAQRAAGLKYKAVGALVAGNTTAIAVKADGPITNVAQLDGKTYGGFGIASDAVIIKEILRRAGVADPKFKEITLNTDAYTALAKGRIDYSVVFAGIDDVTAEAQGTKLRLFPYTQVLGDAGTYPNAAFVASDDAISTKADALKRTLAALSAGYAFAAKDPAAAAKLLVDQNKTELSKQADLVGKEAAIVGPSFVKDGTWGVQADSQWSALTALLAKGGLVKGTPPAPSDLYTNELLPKG